MHDLSLGGCRPEPLAHYLKALGILRLVSEQADRDARGFWSGDTFVLRTALGADDLVAFFAERYAPTPLVGPWNGGSGFYPGDKKAGIDAIADSSSERFAGYRATIAATRRVLDRLGLTQKPEKEAKGPLAERLRSELPEAALDWIDAALVLTDDGLRFPPLLGTGGNDGRLEFSNNQMQRLAELLLGDPSPGLLRAALFGEPARGLTRGKAIGQFAPAGAGGANAGPGFDRDSLLNPWDYVLLLEGALLLAAAATRRLESAASDSLAFPFTVRASASGYASAALADENDARDELWLPLWRAPAALAELRALFAEGRAKVHGAHSRPAATGVDFARAIAGLGVDRGLHSFVRFGFHVRNGQAYLATPLGRWRVPERPAAHLDLLAPLDGWLADFRRKATGKHAPASLGRVLRRLEGALFDLCVRSETRELQGVLIALGEAEAALARARGFTQGAGLRPVPRLPRDWLDRADDDSLEFRLAAALASADLRERLVPVRGGAWLPPGRDDGRTVWTEAALLRNLHACLLRQDIEDSQAASGPTPERARRFAALSDLAAFIDAETDDDRLEALARGLALIDWSTVAPRSPAALDAPPPPAAFAALALALRPAALEVLSPEPVASQRTPGLLARACSGDLRAATTLAVRRLRGYGIRVPDAALDHATARDRLAAALAFPLPHRAYRRLLEQLAPRHVRATSSTEPGIP